MKIVHVVAAALVDGDGRVLLAQRPEGKSLAGLWEFPGGKLEPGESPETALVRELDEELGIVAEELAPFTFVSFGYPDFHLVMLLYWCSRMAATARRCAGSVRGPWLRCQCRPPMCRWSRHWSQQSAPEPATMVAPV
jgi:8-oxo-dGTP diphosphatase